MIAVVLQEFGPGKVAEILWHRLTSFDCCACSCPHGSCCSRVTRGKAVGSRCQQVPAVCRVCPWHSLAFKRTVHFRCQGMACWVPKEPSGGKPSVPNNLYRRRYNSVTA